MKKIVFSLLSVLFLVACSSENTENVGEKGRVPLQISLEQEGLTRSVLEGSLLPSNSKYGVFVTAKETPDYKVLIENGDNRCVTFDGGVSTFDTPVYIPEYQYAYVWAYYPYSESYNAESILTDGFPLEIKSQTDYLVGKSYGAASESSPKVKVQLHHALARIHVLVKRSDYNYRQYTVSDFTFSEVPAYGLYSFNSDICTPDANKTDITITPEYTVIDDDRSTIEADLLLVPGSQQTIFLTLAGSLNKTISLPERYFTAGEKYSIEVVINHEEQLQIGEWSISPWILRDMQGLDFWADDTLE